MEAAKLRKAFTMIGFRCICLASVMSVAALLVCSMGCCPLYAENNGTTLVSVSASLDTKPTVTLGEPIMVHYSVNNTSGQKIGVDWGEGGAGWYTLRLTDSHGVSVAPAPSGSDSQSNGYNMILDPFIAVGNTFTGYLVVSRLFPITRPGKYTLTMHISLPCATVAATEESPIALKKLISASGSLLSQDIAIPLTVTDADVSRATATATALQHQIVQTRDGERLTAQLDALFSMPASAALPSWRLLADEPGMNADALAGELASLRSPAAVDLLVRMYDNPALTLENRSCIGQQLDELYNESDANLKGYIQQIASDHGIVLPDKIPIPLVSD